MEDKDKEFSTWLQKAVKEEGIDKPAGDFTSFVLAKIEEDREFLKDTPLISNSIWWAIAITVIAIFTYVGFGMETGVETWFALNTVDVFSNGHFNISIPKISVSSTFVYAFMGLAFFVYLQIFLLKHHFNKQFM